MPTQHSPSPVDPDRPETTPKPSDLHNIGRWRREPVYLAGVTRYPTNEHGTTQARRRMATRPIGDRSLSAPPLVETRARTHDTEDSDDDNEER